MDGARKACRRPRSAVRARTLSDISSREALQELGSRLVRLQTIDGAQFDGRVVQERLGEDPAVFLFALEGGAEEPIIVPSEHILSIEER